MIARTLTDSTYAGNAPATVWGASNVGNKTRTGQYTKIDCNGTTKTGYQIEWSYGDGNYNRPHSLGCMWFIKY